MKEEIEAFDRYLNERRQEFVGIIIGGAALNFLGVISRATQDIDFIEPKIPLNIKKASIEFAEQHPELKLNVRNSCSINQLRVMAGTLCVRLPWYTFSAIEHFEETLLKNHPQSILVKSSFLDVELTQLSFHENTQGKVYRPHYRKNIIMTIKDHPYAAGEIA